MGTFQQQVFAFADGLTHHDVGVLHKIAQRVGITGIRLADRLWVDGFLVEEIPQQEIALRQVGLQAFAELRRRQHVLHSQAAARRFVGVRGADAPAGSADLSAAALLLAAGIQQAVVRQRDVRLGADEQASTQVDAARLQLLHLLHQ